MLATGLSEKRCRFTENAESILYDDRYSTTVSIIDQRCTIESLLTSGEISV